MKIAVIAGFGPSLLNFRGPLLAALRAAGHEITALAPEDEPTLAADLAAAGVAFRPIRLDRKGTNPVKDLRTLCGLVAALRRLKPDLVFSYTIKPVIYGSLAARLCGIRRVYSMVTGLGHSFGGEGLGRRTLSGVVRLLYRLGLRANRCVLFQNPDDEACFRALGLLAPRQRSAVTAGSGVDLEHFAAAPLPEGPPVFLCAARLLGEKGVGEFVEAARLVRARHPRVVFRLAGPLDPGPDGIAPDQVEAWQREGRIEYLGYVKDVRPLIAASHAFVLPSYYREGVPRSILEALSMGRAVVTTDTPGCRETVQDEVNGYLVPPRDAQALAAALARLLETPDRLARMGAESRKLAEARFDVRLVNAAILRAMELA
jgi:glycosyltransferase involved in cell wall biosynthesis